MENNIEKDVHTEHCCVHHGCKYFDENCTVITGQKKQSFSCEDCEYDEEAAYKQAIDFALNEANDGLYFLRALRHEKWQTVEELFPAFAQKAGAAYFKKTSPFQ